MQCRILRRTLHSCNVRIKIVYCILATSVIARVQYFRIGDNILSSVGINWWQLSKSQACDRNDIDILRAEHENR